MNNTKEIRLEMRIKNNILYSAIMKKYKTVKNFCGKNNVSYQMVCNFISLRYRPYVIISEEPFEVEYKMLPRKLASLLGVEVSELFPEWLYLEIKRNMVVKELDKQDITPYLRTEETRLLEGVDPVKVYEQTELKDNLEEALGYLSEKERMVIVLRFGLEGNKSHTLKAIGKKLGVSQERVRQTETKVLQKLKEHPKSVKLRDTHGKFTRWT